MKLSLLSLCLCLSLPAAGQRPQHVIAGPHSRHSKELTLEQGRVIATIEAMFRALVANDKKSFDSLTKPGFYRKRVVLAVMSGCQSYVST
jgi:hypothetical protein